MYPNARITWIVHPQFGTFVPEQPILDEVIYFDKKAFSKMSVAGKLKEFFRMRSLLRSKNFDLVLDLQGLFKSAVVAWMTGCRNCFGNVGIAFGWRFCSFCSLLCGHWVMVPGRCS